MFRITHGGVVRLCCTYMMSRPSLFALSAQHTKQQMRSENKGNDFDVMQNMVVLSFSRARNLLPYFLQKIDSQRTLWIVAGRRLVGKHCETVHTNRPLANAKNNNSKNMHVEVWTLDAQNKTECLQGLKSHLCGLLRPNWSWHGRVKPEMGQAIFTLVPSTSTFSRMLTSTSKFNQMPNWWASNLNGPDHSLTSKLKT